jgi:hypothetical protein
MNGQFDRLVQMLVPSDRCFACDHLRLPWEEGIDRAKARAVYVRGLLAYCMAGEEPVADAVPGECAYFQETPEQPKPSA